MIMISLHFILFLSPFLPFASLPFVSLFYCYELLKQLFVVTQDTGPQQMLPNGPWKAVDTSGILSPVFTFPSTALLQIPLKCTTYSFSWSNFSSSCPIQEMEFQRVFLQWPSKLTMGRAACCCIVLSFVLFLQEPDFSPSFLHLHGTLYCWNLVQIILHRRRNVNGISYTCSVEFYEL